MSACLSSYVELRPCRPKTEKLNHLLAECPYRGPEYEGEGEEGTGWVVRSLEDPSMETEEESFQPKRKIAPKKVGRKVFSSWSLLVLVTRSCFWFVFGVWDLGVLCMYLHMESVLASM